MPDYLKISAVLLFVEGIFLFLFWGVHARAISPDSWGVHALFGIAHPPHTLFLLPRTGPSILLPLAVFNSIFIIMCYRHGVKWAWFVLLAVYLAVLIPPTIGEAISPGIGAEFYKEARGSGRPPWFNEVSLRGVIISGLRRRGYTPEAVRDFCDRIGVARRDNTVDIALLEHTLRDDLNKKSPRVMGVLDPLKVVIENYPEGQTEEIVSVNNPEDMSMGERTIPFSRTLYIEQDDFREEPPPKFYRLSPGREIRLKDAYYITCTGVVKDEATGEITELRCTYDPETHGGTSSDGRKVRGTSHWVSAEHAVDAEVRIYDHLFLKEDPDDLEDGGDFRDNLNPESLVVLKSCKVEQGLEQAKPGERFQFLRQGYFCVDPDSSPDSPVFNRTVALRDTWSRMDKASRRA